MNIILILVFSFKQTIYFIDHLKHTKIVNDNLVLKNRQQGNELYADLSSLIIKIKNNKHESVAQKCIFLKSPSSYPVI